MAAQSADEKKAAPELKTLAWVFLKLSVTGFGGPAAHLAMMREEVVTRRRWLSPQQFLDLMGVCNLLPGPNSTEMALHVGYTRAGWRGLLVAGVCFITPAALITLALAWAYGRYGRLPQAQGMMALVKPVVLAVVVQAVWSLGRLAVQNRFGVLLGVAVLVASLGGVGEIPLLAAAALAGVAVARLRPGVGGVANLAVAVLPAAAGAAPFSHAGLFWFFLKTGSVLYGSGYVLLAFLQTGLVNDLGWLSQAQLLDAVAVGQFTPGPVFTTATFVGYLLGGLAGAGLATAGIFLPSFVLVGLSGWFVPGLRRSPFFSAALDAMNTASVALMAGVCLTLGRPALTNAATVGLFGLCLWLLLRWRVNPSWLVLAAAVLGGLAGVAGWPGLT